MRSLSPISLTYLCSLSHKPPPDPPTSPPGPPPRTPRPTPHPKFPSRSSTARSRFHPPQVSAVREHCLYGKMSDPLGPYWPLGQETLQSQLRNIALLAADGDGRAAEWLETGRGCTRGEHAGDNSLHDSTVSAVADDGVSAHVQRVPPLVGGADGAARGEGERPR